MAANQQQEPSYSFCMQIFYIYKLNSREENHMTFIVLLLSKFIIVFKGRMLSFYQSRNHKSSKFLKNRILD